MHTHPALPDDTFLPPLTPPATAAAPSGLILATATSTPWPIQPEGAVGAVLADPADWPTEQLWLHPDGRIFDEHRRPVEASLHIHLADVPPRFTVGPLGCSTARNVMDFLRDGQPDRAWRLAARLCLAMGSRELAAWPRQFAADLAISALLLAGETHGCVLGAVEAIALLGDLAERAAADELTYPGLPVSGTPLAVRIRRRRDVALERLAARMALDGSPEAAESLFWRAPVLLSRNADHPAPRSW
jgi:hypothetical protein